MISVCRRDSNPLSRARVRSGRLTWRNSSASGGPPLARNEVPRRLQRAQVERHGDRRRAPRRPAIDGTASWRRPASASSSAVSRCTVAPGPAGATAGGAGCRPVPAHRGSRDRPQTRAPSRRHVPAARDAGSLLRRCSSLVHPARGCAAIHTTQTICSSSRTLTAAVNTSELACRCRAAEGDSLHGHGAHDRDDQRIGAGREPRRRSAAAPRPSLQQRCRQRKRGRSRRAPGASAPDVPDSGETRGGSTTRNSASCVDSSSFAPSSADSRRATIWS